MSKVAFALPDRRGAEEENLDYSRLISRHGLGLVMMSLLTDVQDLIALGMTDEAHKAINSIKQLADTKMPKHNFLPGAVTAQAKVAELRAVHSGTTPGKWTAMPARGQVVVPSTVESKRLSGQVIVTAAGQKAEDTKDDVVFIAKAHGAMPPLLKAVELVEYMMAEQEALDPEQRNAYFSTTAEQMLIELRNS